MRAVKLARELAAARKDRTRSRFRESFQLSPGRQILCESKSEWKFWESFSEALAKGHLKPHELSIRDLFEHLVKDGRELVETFSPRNGDGAGTRELIEHERNLREAAGAVTSGDFSNITGQIIYNRLIESLTPEDFPFQNLIPTQPTQFNGEKIAGIANLGDQAQIVRENHEYPIAGVGEDWIESPQTTKRGFIVPLTKEAIFFDRTGQLLQKAGDVGGSLMLNKEKRAIDCVIDENRTQHRYKWRGTVYATYQATTPWDNVTASNALVDWTDIDSANQTLNGITDPNTGEPVVVEADTLIVTKQNELAALRIRNATEITVATPGFATSGNPTETKLANPVGGAFEVISSRLLATRLATDTDWFYGNPRRAFVYMENWGITVVQAPANNSDDFNRDIVNKFKASERGEFFTVEPRLVSKNTVA